MGYTGRHKAQPLPETKRGNPGILIGYGRGCALCLPVRLLNGPGASSGQVEYILVVDAEALRLLQLPLEGTHHRGADDAWNIAAILAELMKRYRTV